MPPPPPGPAAALGTALLLILLASESAPSEYRAGPQRGLGGETPPHNTPPPPGRGNPSARSPAGALRPRAPRPRQRRIPGPAAGQGDRACGPR